MKSNVLKVIKHLNRFNLKSLNRYNLKPALSFTKEANVLLQ